MKTKITDIRCFATRALMMLALLLTPTMTMWGQKANEKFSATTKMFLNELKQQEEKPTAGPRRAAEWKPANPDQPVPDRITIPSTKQYVKAILHRYHYYKKQESSSAKRKKAAR